MWMFKNRNSCTYKAGQDSAWCSEPKHLGSRFCVIQTDLDQWILPLCRSDRDRTREATTALLVCVMATIDRADMAANICAK